MLQLQTRAIAAMLSMLSECMVAVWWKPCSTRSAAAIASAASRTRNSGMTGISSSCWTNGCCSSTSHTRSRRSWPCPPIPICWDSLFRFIRPEWIDETTAIKASAEQRRALADYNTGSVPLAAGVILRALVEWFQPAYVVEIGTFVGMSTLCLRGTDPARQVFSCDKSNDCFQVGENRRYAAKAPPGLHLFAKTGSTRMLRELAATNALDGLIDLFFFDGRIQDPDLELIGQLAHRDTIYAFDDYHGNEKGVINYRDKLGPWLEATKRHHRARVMLEPCFASTRYGANTIAILVPLDFHVAGQPPVTL